MRGRAAVAAGLLVSVVVLLVGCSEQQAPQQSSRPSASVTAEPTPTATSTLSPEAAAAQERFDDANQSLAAANGSADDRAIVDGLVAAGFEKSAMQITPDTTTIGRRVDSIEVSALVGETCLVGQFRGSSYVGLATPVLSTGRCLIGTTRAIDW